MLPLAALNHMSRRNTVKADQLSTDFEWDPLGTDPRGFKKSWRAPRRRRPINKGVDLTGDRMLNGLLAKFFGVEIRPRSLPQSQSFSNSSKYWIAERQNPYLPLRISLRNAS
jgi:hypothetical protein